MHVSSLLVFAMAIDAALSQGCDQNAIVSCIESPDHPPCAVSACACSEIQVQTSCYKAYCNDPSIIGNFLAAASILSSSFCDGDPVGGGSFTFITTPLSFPATAVSTTAAGPGTLTTATSTSPVASPSSTIPPATTSAPVTTSPPASQSGTAMSASNSPAVAPGTTSTSKAAAEKLQVAGQGLFAAVLGILAYL